MSVSRGHVAGSMRKTIENLREANAGLLKANQGWQDRCLAMQTERDALRQRVEELEKGKMEGYIPAPVMWALRASGMPESVSDNTTISAWIYALRQRVEELEREKITGASGGLRRLARRWGVRSIEDIRDTGAAWVTEAELAMLCAFAKRAETSEMALREWREAESSPDCIACCTLDAALAEEVKR